MLLDPNNVMAGLNVQFSTDVQSLLTASTERWQPYRGLASFADQQKLYDAYLAGGPMAAMPGRSAHNYAVAVDVALVLDSGLSYGEEDPPLAAWVWLWDACRQHQRLRSGHWFPPIAKSDNDHIEADEWVTSIKPALKAAGKW